MRTTVRLPDELMRVAKRFAADRGTTLTAVMSESLRQRIGRGGDKGRAARPRPMPIFHGTGTRPGVDLTSTSSLLARTEKRHGPS
jgi:hypothetical protein